MRDEQPTNTPTIVTIIMFFVVTAAIIGGGVLLLQTRPEPVEVVIHPPIPTATPLPTATPSPLTVYVTGAVATPEQLVELPPDSRVSDAIAAAGGATDNADLTRVNLADTLRDGAQVHVPARPVATQMATVEAGIVDLAPTVAAAEGLATPITPERINVNTATIEELITLPGIGEVTAERIIAYREENGAFSTLADLDNVSGIGSATLENIAALVTFD
jgi:competence protein ComEA